MAPKIRSMGFFKENVKNSIEFRQNFQCQLGVQSDAIFEQENALGTPSNANNQLQFFRSFILNWVKYRESDWSK